MLLESAPRDLVVRRWGAGPSVLLVHGAIAGAHASWAHLRPMVDGWSLVAPNRRGYHPRTPTESEDFERDAVDAASLLVDPMHVVGHSYGAIVALLTAGIRPEHVRSLTLLEPPPLSGTHQRPGVRRWLEQMGHLRASGPMDPVEFVAEFFRLVGGPSDAHHSDQLVEQIRLLRSSRPVWSAQPDFELARSHGIPTMVVSGAHSEVFEAAADDIATQLGARRERIVGAGHFVQKDPRFAEVLTKFLSESTVAIT